MTDDDRPRRRPRGGRQPARRPRDERRPRRARDAGTGNGNATRSRVRAAEPDGPQASEELDDHVEDVDDLEDDVDEFEDDEDVAEEPEEPARHDGGRRPRTAARTTERGSPARNGSSPAHGNGALLPAAAARRAAEQIVVLTGRELESVVSIERDRDEGGWRIGIEVVETHRIPDSADILAMFEVRVDEHGELAGFRRLGRYSRGRVHEGGGR